MLWTALLAQTAPAIDATAQAPDTVCADIVRKI